MIGESQNHRADRRRVVVQLSYPLIPISLLDYFAVTVQVPIFNRSLRSVQGSGVPINRISNRRQLAHLARLLSPLVLGTINH